jgi:hypothetical protein
MNITHLDPRIWGPTFWFFLHLLTLGYPTHPNAVTKKKYYDFFQHHLPVFLPVDNMSKDFTELLNTYPVSPYLDSQESLVKWMVFIHNKINKKLEKPEISLAEFYQLYEEKIRPPEQRYWEKKRFYEKFGFFLLCIVCLVILIMVFFER